MPVSSYQYDNWYHCSAHRIIFRYDNSLYVYLIIKVKNYSLKVSNNKFVYNIKILKTFFCMPSLTVITRFPRNVNTHTHTHTRLPLQKTLTAVYILVVVNLMIKVCSIYLNLLQIEILILKLHMAH